MDVEHPDFEHFPGLKDAQGFKAVLEAGETLYIPSGYWHHIVYDEASCVISLRCTSQTWLGKLQGFYNLIIMSSLDHLMNKISPQPGLTGRNSRYLEAINKTLQKLSQMTGITLY